MGSAADGSIGLLYSHSSVFALVAIQLPMCANAVSSPGPTQPLTQVTLTASFILSYSCTLGFVNSVSSEYTPVPHLPSYEHIRLYWKKQVHVCSVCLLIYCTSQPREWSSSSYGEFYFSAVMAMYVCPLLYCTCIVYGIV